MTAFLAGLAAGVAVTLAAGAAVGVIIDRQTTWATRAAGA